jgi:hypothetical protein
LFHFSFIFLLTKSKIGREQKNEGRRAYNYTMKPDNKIDFCRRIGENEIGGRGGDIKKEEKEKGANHMKPWQLAREQKVGLGK